jgi:hypothetical protein
MLVLINPDNFISLEILLAKEIGKIRKARVSPNYETHIKTNHRR